MSRLLAAAVVLACGCSDGLDLTVDLRTDFEPGTDFVSIEASLDDGIAQMRPATALDDVIGGVRVAEFSGVSRGERQITVVLRDASGGVVATRVLRLTLESSFGLTVVIARGCLDPCVGGLQRQGCACVTAQCVAAADLCALALCETNADCPAPAFGCVEAVCAEGAACLEAPRDERCGPGERCSTTGGCVPDTTPVDGGADGAPSDTSLPDAVVLRCAIAADCADPSTEVVIGCSPVAPICAGAGTEQRRDTSWDCVAGRCEPTNVLNDYPCTYDPIGLFCSEVPCGQCDAMDSCKTVAGGMCGVDGVDGLCDDSVCCLTCIESAACHATGLLDTACGNTGEACRACPAGETCQAQLSGGTCR